VRLKRITLTQFTKYQLRAMFLKGEIDGELLAKTVNHLYLRYPLSEKDGYPLLALGKEEVIHFFHQRSEKRV
jgi:hypothetical protein